MAERHRGEMESGQKRDGNELSSQTNNESGCDRRCCFPYWAKWNISSQAIINLAFTWGGVSGRRSFLSKNPPIVLFTINARWDSQALLFISRWIKHISSQQRALNSSHSLRSWTIAFSYQFKRRNGLDGWTLKLITPRIESSHFSRIFPPLSKQNSDILRNMYLVVLHFWTFFRNIQRVTTDKTMPFNFFKTLVWFFLKSFR